MTERQPLATHTHSAERVPESLEFLKRTRSELRSLARVRVFVDRVQVFDVNHDYFELLGVGYPDPDVVTVLRALNVPFNRETIHTAASEPFKEFRTGRRHPWAEDRVM
jgi:hypothetical protein